MKSEAQLTTVSQYAFKEWMFAEWAQMVRSARRHLKRDNYVLPEFRATIFMEEQYQEVRDVLDWMLQFVIVTQDGHVLIRDDCEGLRYRKTNYKNVLNRVRQAKKGREDMPAKYSYD